MSDLGLTPDKVQICRSIKVGTRRTSIRMEREFWDALDKIRQWRGLTMQQVLDQATDGDNDANRTASIKTWILAFYKDQINKIHSDKWA